MTARAKGSDPPSRQPSSLGLTPSRWRAFVRRVATVQAAVWLTVVYGLLWLPVGLFTRLLADWLRRKAPARSNWRAREARLNDPAHLREPF